MTCVCVCGVSAFRDVCVVFLHCMMCAVSLACILSYGCVTDISRCTRV